MVYGDNNRECKCMTTWLPSGKLDDGTLLFGPLREKPKNSDPVLELKIDNITWWVNHSGRDLTQEQKDNIYAWGKTQIHNERV